jgi:ADP-heptose:LPS heptosyltransferase
MKIAILRALQLGDLLCVVPALRALRAAYADARITLIGLAWARQFVGRFHRYLDGFIEFPQLPGAGQVDLALQMHGSGETMNPIALSIGARRTAGFYRTGPAPDSFIPWREREHEVLRYLRLMAHLGVPAQGVHLEFPLQENDFRELQGFGLNHYAIVHPGSQLESRRWPAERFARVADTLADEGLRVALTGSAAEAPLTRRVAQAMRAPALDLAGRTSLGGIAALIAHARLLVSNDTGVSHIAAAVGTRSVIVCCGADPQRWAPLDAQRHRVVHYEVECRPCMHASCPIGHPCALGVSTQSVIDEAQRMAACAA